MQSLSLNQQKKSYYRKILKCFSYLSDVVDDLINMIVHIHVNCVKNKIWFDTEIHIWNFIHCSTGLWSPTTPIQYTLHSYEILRVKKNVDYEMFKNSDFCEKFKIYQEDIEYHYRIVRLWMIARICQFISNFCFLSTIGCIFKIIRSHYS